MKIKNLKFIVFLIILIESTRSTCGKTCHDCRNNICYTCKESKWNKKTKKCEKIPESESKNCEVWSRDGLCVQCKTGTITEYIPSKTTGFEIKCNEFTDPKKRNDPLKNCLLLKESIINGVKKKFCFICGEGMIPTAKKDACFQLSGETEGCFSYYSSDHIDSCYNCGGEQTLVGFECKKQSGKMVQCSNAISKNRCIVCKDNYYLSKDGTCKSVNSKL